MMERDNRAGKTLQEKGEQLKLTTEQEAILQSTGDIRINAVAGSGKTTTIIQYAATRPPGSRILYLAYNKSVKLEAKKRFADAGLAHVKVETAHSLAYKLIVAGGRYQVRQQEYKTHEIAALLGLQGNGEKHGEYIIANHINKFISYFCNSQARRVQELNYLDVVSDEKAKAFVKAFYTSIEHGTRLLLGKMNSGEIEITHDFYLKKFQLSNPFLPFDYILFDEGQDASPAMLDVFLKQQATKLIVGDSHQQIYSWRHAVNSLEKTGFPSFQLTTSFRFPQEIANLAMEILSWKNHLKETPPVAIKGIAPSKKAVSKATIARTNLGLLLKAITYITEHPEVNKLYFEGNIHSYTYADDGASLYDVLNLHNQRHSSIRDQLIGSMKDLDELEDYIEKTEDVQLAMMVEIVKEYGNEIPGLIKSLKAKHVDDADKASAEMIFSTVHRSKGMEYDAVQLVEDFVTESKLLRLVAEKKEDEIIPIAKWNEEINLLYVAATRTKGLLRIPESLLPAGFPPSTLIQVIKKQKEKEPEEGRKGYVEQRLAQKNGHKSWNNETDMELVQLFHSGASIDSLADYFGKNKGAVYFRLRKLGCLGED